MPGAVSDSSTLIHLSTIGRLDLLREFYSAVHIPPSVWREVVLEGGERPGAAEVRRAREEEWITVASPTNTALVHVLGRELDEGESQAIALAVEMQPAVLLLDETDARRMARTFQVPISGAVGTLIRARLEGKIPSLRVELDCLRDPGGFWLSNAVYAEALKAVGEDVKPPAKGEGTPPNGAET